MSQGTQDRAQGTQDRSPDNSTYRKGTLPSTGFKAVLVSGILVLEEDEVLLQTTAGKPIRFAPVEQ